MPVLLVVNDPSQWPLEVPGVQIVAARGYLTDPEFTRLRNTRVFNLCRHYRYQSLGYYVSLLAEARGHHPRPNTLELQGFRDVATARDLNEEIGELVNQAFAPLRSRRFELSIYFGRNLAKKYQRISNRLFNAFPAPLLRAFFEKRKGRWELRRVAPIAFAEIPNNHKDFVLQAATDYFNRKRFTSQRPSRTRYSLAILHYPEEEDAPSDLRALKRFIKASVELGIGCDLITKQDLGRLGEYDALFIRETTAVNHHTYRFARRAEAMGMAVIDDPASIMRCSNKVFLAELLAKAKIPTPPTAIIHRDNIEAVLREVGLPCVLKQPDSAFSLGVKKVETAAEFKELAEKLLQRSDLVIAQGFTPSEFDWRIGVLKGKAMTFPKKSGHDLLYPERDEEERNRATQTLQ